MLGEIKKELGIKTRTPGIFHKFIAEKIKLKLNGNTTIKRKDIRTLLYCHAISIQMQERFLKEMENYGLIKIIDKQNIQILKTE